VIIPLEIVCCCSSQQALHTVQLFHSQLVHQARLMTCAARALRFPLYIYVYIYVYIYICCHSCPSINAINARFPLIRPASTEVVSIVSVFQETSQAHDVQYPDTLGVKHAVTWKGDTAACTSHLLRISCWTRLPWRHTRVKFGTGLPGVVPVASRMPLPAAQNTV
jgi:hypothetical protein